MLDVARRLQRLVRLSAGRARRSSTPSSCTTASRRGSTSRWSTPNHITPYGEIPRAERELADDLVFNRREDALQRFIDHFEAKGEAAEEETADPTAGMEPEEALHFHILRRKKDGVEDWIDALASRRSARSRR